MGRRFDRITELVRGARTRGAATNRKAGATLGRRCGASGLVAAAVVAPLFGVWLGDVLYERGDALWQQEAEDKRNEVPLMHGAAADIDALAAALDGGAPRLRTVENGFGQMATRLDLPDGGAYLLSGRLEAVSSDAVAVAYPSVSSDNCEKLTMSLPRGLALRTEVSVGTAPPHWKGVPYTPAAAAVLCGTVTTDIAFLVRRAP